MTAGDIQTISFDDLEFETWYTVVVSTAALGANTLNKLEADTFMFKTLPEPPSCCEYLPGESGRGSTNQFSHEH